jgi:hypothetical protein
MAKQVRSALDLRLNQIQNVVAHRVATDPATPAAGQFWYNTTQNLLKYYTGTVTIVVRQSDINATANTNILRDSAGKAFATEFEAGLFTITGTPSNANHAVRKQDLDAVVQGIQFKGTARCATTTNLTGYVQTGNQLVHAGNVGNLLIDGVVPQAGDTVLIKNQTTASQNGLYTLLEDSLSQAVFERHVNMDANTEVKGAVVHVSSGTVGQGTGWLISGNGPFTLGTSAINFVQFNYLTDILADGALSKTANTISLNTSSDFNQTGSVLNLSDTGVTAGTFNGITVDGKGRVTAAVNVSAPVFDATITGDGTTTTFTITHNLASSNPSVTLRQGGSEVIVENATSGNNAVVIEFGIAPTNGETFAVRVAAN